jgi:hypothetical protein
MNATYPRYSRIQTTRKARACDDCVTAIPVGSAYVVVPMTEPGAGIGPHQGYRYLCLACGAQRGFIGQVVTHGR